MRAKSHKAARRRLCKKDSRARTPHTRRPRTQTSVLLSTSEKPRTAELHVDPMKRAGASKHRPALPSPCVTVSTNRNTGEGLLCPPPPFFAPPSFLGREAPPFCSPTLRGPTLHPWGPTLRGPDFAAPPGPHKRNLFLARRRPPSQDPQEEGMVRGGFEGRGLRREGASKGGLRRGTASPKGFERGSNQRKVWFKQTLHPPPSSLLNQKRG